jgi:hypothetical protein
VIRTYAAIRKAAVPDETREEDALDAVEAWETRGELPEDPAMRAFVLVDAELRALERHRKGVDVAAEMGLFAEIAGARGGELEGAIGRLLVLRCGRAADG